MSLAHKTQTWSISKCLIWSFVRLLTKVSLKYTWLTHYTKSTYVLFGVEIPQGLSKYIVQYSTTWVDVSKSQRPSIFGRQISTFLDPHKKTLHIWMMFVRTATVMGPKALYPLDNRLDKFHLSSIREWYTSPCTNIWGNLVNKSRIMHYLKSYCC